MIVGYSVRNGAGHRVDEEGVVFAVEVVVVGDGRSGGVVDPVEEKRRLWWIWRHFFFFILIV